MDIKDATLEELEAEIALRKAAEIASEASTAQGEVQAVIDASTELTDLGASTAPDTVDPQWVKLTFDLVTPTGYQKAFVVGILKELVENYGAKATADADTVRVRKDRAISHLNKISTLLTA